MRVHFIFPNFDCPLGVSIGLSYVAGMVKRAGHDVAVTHVAEGVGFPYDLERVVDSVRTADPGLVCISSGHNHYAETRQMVEAIETRLKVPVLLGGIHATLNVDDVLRENPSLSFLNIGEGEEATLDLVTALDQGLDVTHIPNVQARTNGTVHRNAVRPFMNLADLADMETDMWEFQKVTDLRRGWVNVSAQRGCPYRCTYCHNNGVTKVLAQSLGKKSWSNSDLGYLRYRPADRMCAELKSLCEKYRIDAFSFIDDTFTMNRDWLRELLTLYQQEVDVPYVCNTTAVDIDDETLKLMADTGCRVIRLGVESGGAHILNDLLKRAWVSPKRIHWAFQRIQEHGMHALAFLMIGNLNETRDDTRLTFQFTAKIKPTSMRLAVAYPYPGTEYHDRARAANAVDPTRSSHNYLTRSVMRQDPEHDLWLDKVRTFYFWYINTFLGNESTPVFEKLVTELESLPRDKWNDPEVQRSLWRRHEAITNDFQERKVFHYTTPFADRTDIVISSLVVAEHGEIIRKEANEPH